MHTEFFLLSLKCGTIASKRAEKGLEFGVSSFVRTMTTLHEAQCVVCHQEVHLEELLALF